MGEEFQFTILSTVYFMQYGQLAKLCSVHVGLSPTLLILIFSRFYWSLTKNFWTWWTHWNNKCSSKLHSNNWYRYLDLNIFESQLINRDAHTYLFLLFARSYAAYTIQVRKWFSASNCLPFVKTSDDHFIFLWYPYYWELFLVSYVSTQTAAHPRASPCQTWEERKITVVIVQWEVSVAFFNWLHQTAPKR